MKAPGRVSLPEPLDRRFEACVFDWDGTAVADRAADAGKARDLFAALLGSGFDLAVITGTKLANVDDQLGLRPDGPGRMLVCCNRGSEVFELGPDGAAPLFRRSASAREDEQLSAGARRCCEPGLASAASRQGSSPTG